jgi:hypothetical protein
MELKNEVSKCKEVATKMLNQLFDVVPLNETQKELAITIGAQLYNQGGIDALKEFSEKGFV